MFNSFSTNEQFMNNVLRNLHTILSNIPEGKTRASAQQYLDKINILANDTLHDGPIYDFPTILDPDRVLGVLNAVNVGVGKEFGRTITTSGAYHELIRDVGRLRQLKTATRKANEIVKSSSGRDKFLFSSLTGGKRSEIQGNLFKMGMVKGSASGSIDLTDVDGSPENVIDIYPRITSSRQEGNPTNSASAASTFLHELGHRLELKLKLAFSKVPITPENVKKFHFRTGSGAHTEDLFFPGYLNRIYKPLAEVQKRAFKNSYDAAISGGRTEQGAEDYAKYASRTNEIFAREFSNFIRTGKTTYPELLEVMKYAVSSLTKEDLNILTKLMRTLGSKDFNTDFESLYKISVGRVPEGFKNVPGFIDLDMEEITHFASGGRTPRGGKRLIMVNENGQQEFVISASVLADIERIAGQRIENDTQLREIVSMGIDAGRYQRSKEGRLRTVHFLGDAGVEPGVPVTQPAGVASGRSSKKKFNQVFSAPPAKVEPGYVDATPAMPEVSEGSNIVIPAKKVVDLGPAAFRGKQPAQAKQEDKARSARNHYISLANSVGLSPTIVSKLVRELNKTDDPRAMEAIWNSFVNVKDVAPTQGVELSRGTQRRIQELKDAGYSDADVVNQLKLTNPGTSVTEEIVRDFGITHSTKGVKPRKPQYPPGLLRGVETLSKAGMDAAGILEAINKLKPEGEKYSRKDIVKALDQIKKDNMEFKAKTADPTSASPLDISDEAMANIMEAFGKGIPEPPEFPELSDEQLAELMGVSLPGTTKAEPKAKSATTVEQRVARMNEGKKKKAEEKAAAKAKEQQEASKNIMYDKPIGPEKGSTYAGAVEMRAALHSAYLASGYTEEEVAKLDEMMTGKSMKEIKGIQNTFESQVMQQRQAASKKKTEDKPRAPKPAPVVATTPAQKKKEIRAKANTESAERGDEDGFYEPPDNFDLNEVYEAASNNIKKLSASGLFTSDELASIEEELKNLADPTEVGAATNALLTKKKLKSQGQDTAKKAAVQRSSTKQKRPSKLQERRLDPDRRNIVEEGMKRILGDSYSTATPAQMSRALAESLRLNVTDPMTGLPGTRAFHAQKDVLGSTYSIVGDVSGLKKTNDTYGHDAGDDFIKQYAEELKKALPNTVFRPNAGGDEFAAFAPTKKEAERISKAMKKAAQELMVKTKDKQGKEVTLTGYDITTGVAKGASGEEAFKAADQLVNQQRDARKAAAGGADPRLLAGVHEYVPPEPKPASTSVYASKDSKKAERDRLKNNAIAAAKAAKYSPAQVADLEKALSGQSIKNIPIVAQNWFADNSPEVPVQQAPKPQTPPPSTPPPSTPPPSGGSGGGGRRGGRQTPPPPPNNPPPPPPSGGGGGPSRPTQEQRRILKKHGWTDAQIDQMTRQQAAAIIEGILNTPATPPTTPPTSGGTTPPTGGGSTGGGGRSPSGGIPFSTGGGSGGGGGGGGSTGGGNPQDDNESLSGKKKGSAAEERKKRINATINKVLNDPESAALLKEAESELGETIQSVNTASIKYVKDLSRRLKILEVTITRKNGLPAKARVAEDIDTGEIGTLDEINAIRSEARAEARLQRREAKRQVEIRNQMDELGKKYPKIMEKLYNENPEFINPQGKLSLKTRELGQLRKHEFGIENEETGERTTKRITTDLQGNIIPEAAQRVGRLTDAIARNAKEFLTWSLAVGLIYGPMQKLQQLLDISIKNQTLLANALVTVGKSQEFANVIFENSLDIANATGVSVQGVIEGYNLALRATGNLTDETERFNTANTLLKDSITLSKLAAIDQSSATDILVASLKQMGEPLDQGSMLLDKWVRVSQVANVDVNTLATSFAIVAESAKNAGLDIDELNGVIATVAQSGITNAKETGNAVRAIISGVSTDQASKELQRFGVAVTDVTGKARPFKEIMNDIKELRDAKLISGDDMTRIGLAIGQGNRRAPQVINTIMGLDTVGSVASESARANGEAERALAIQLQTVEARITLLSNAFIKLAQVLGTDGGVLSAAQGAIDMLTKLVEVLSVVGKIAGGGLVVGGAVGLGKIAGLGDNITNVGYSLAEKDYARRFRRGIDFDAERKMLAQPGIYPTMRIARRAQLEEDLNMPENMARFQESADKFQTRAVAGLTAVGFAAPWAGEGKLAAAATAAGASLAGSFVGSMTKLGPGVGGIIGGAVADIILRIFDKKITEMNNVKFNETNQPIPGEEKEPFDYQKEFDKLSREDKLNLLAATGGQPVRSQFEMGLGIEKGKFDIDTTKATQGFFNKNMSREEAAALYINSSAKEGQSFFLKALGGYQNENTLTAQELYNIVGGQAPGEFEANSSKFIKPLLDKYKNSGVIAEEQAKAETYLKGLMDVNSPSRIGISEYNRRMSAVEGFDASIPSLVASASINNFASMPQDINANTAYSQFAKLLTMGSPESVSEITALSSEIQELYDRINRAKEAGQTQLEVTPGGEKKDLSYFEDLLVKRQEQLGTAVGQERYNIQTRTPIRDTIAQKNVSQDFFGKLAEKAKEIDAEAIKVMEAINPDEAAAMKARNESTRFMIRFADGWKNLEGVTQDGFQGAIDFYKKLGELKEIQQTAGFTDYKDFTPEQIQQAANLANAKHAELKKFGNEQGIPYDGEITSQIVEGNDKNLRLLTTNFALFQLFLQEIANNTKKMVDGMYNLPDGSTFWIPMSAVDAYYQKGSGDKGGETQRELTQGEKTDAERLKAQATGLNAAIDTENARRSNLASANRYQGMANKYFEEQAANKFTNTFSSVPESLRTLLGASNPIRLGNQIPDTVLQGGKRLTSRDMQTPSVNTRLNLDVRSNITLQLDGRILWNSIKRYAAADLIKFGTSSTSTTRTVVT